MLISPRGKEWDVKWNNSDLLLQIGEIFWIIGANPLCIYIKYMLLRRELCCDAHAANVRLLMPELWIPDPKQTTRVKARREERRKTSVYRNSIADTVDKHLINSTIIYVAFLILAILRIYPIIDNNCLESLLHCYTRRMTFTVQKFCFLLALVWA